MNRILLFIYMATVLLFAVPILAHNNVVIIPLNSDDKIVHCDGNPRGGLIFDACGVCGGDGSSCILDCNSDEGGTAYIDSCGFCVGGNTGKTSEVICVTSESQIWMDRNLGASQVATSSTDSAAYGDLYQWGRLTDGHEKRTSPTTTLLSSTDVPGHGNFILNSSDPYDWRVPQNSNLWQGVSGINNPCPTGFRLPTEAEWETERLSWSSNDPDGAYTSPLKLTAAHMRNHTGFINTTGIGGYYWSSTIDFNGVWYDLGRFLYIDTDDRSHMGGYNLRYGLSVRCIKD